MDDRLLRYSKVLRVVYVYEYDADKTEYYDLIFKDVKYLSYDDFLQTQVFEADIVFVNFSTKDIRSLFRKLLTLSATKVIFTPYETHAAFLKNALKFKIDVVMKKTTDETALNSLFQTLVKNIINEYKKIAELKRYETIIKSNLHGFCIIDNMNVVYISDKIKEDFKVESATQFNESYFNTAQSKIKQLIEARAKEQYVEITTKDEVTHSYIATVTNIPNGLLLSLTPLQMIKKQKSNQALSRIVFIEELKILLFTVIKRKSI